MARIYLTPIDLSKNELRQAVVHLLGSDPGSPTEGQIWYNTASHVPKFRNASANIDLTNPTQLNSQAGSYYLARANHTGTQLANTISDFDTQVRTSRLDQMATPTADVAHGGFKITGLGNGTASSDAATYGQVTAAIQGLSWKQSARVATTAALATNSRTGNVLTASANAALVIDGVTMAVNDRVVVKNEATGANNGIFYVSATGSGAAVWTLTRSLDADTAVELEDSAIFVDEGTSNAGTAWNLTTDAITVNTTALVFVQFGAGSTYSATAPIVLTGNAFSIAYTARLVNNGGSLDLAASIVTAGTYTVVTVDTYGRTTAGAQLASGATGIIAQTASGVYSARTITGTAARITMTNGDGVAGAPTIDIAATYVGQTSITTLGTIATGTWSGTVIGAAYGGLGIDTTASAANKLTARGTINVPGIYTALIGDGSTLTYNITQATHLLRSDGAMIVGVYDAAGYNLVNTDVSINATNGTVTIGFAPTAPASNAYRVVIHG